MSDEYFEQRFVQNQNQFAANWFFYSRGVDELHIRHDDGTKQTIELMDNFPMNRKSMAEQIAAVKPGERYKPGQLLVKSNATDHTGAMALGVNARMAYSSRGPE